MGRLFCQVGGGGHANFRSSFCLLDLRKPLDVGKSETCICPAKPSCLKSGLKMPCAPMAKDSSRPRLLPSILALSSLLEFSRLQHRLGAQATRAMRGTRSGIGIEYRE